MFEEQEAQPPQRQRTSFPKNHILPKPRLHGLHLRRWQYGSSFSEFDTVGSETCRFFCKI